MQGKYVKDFTKGNTAKQLIVFSTPLFLSNLLQVLYNMVDMIVVGNVLGKTGISAVSVGGDVTNLLTFIAMGFASAGQVIIARYIGAKRQKDIGLFVGTMGGFLALCSILLSVIGFTFKDTLLKLMNTPADAYKGALEYSVICILGLAFICGYNVVAAVLRGMGDSKHPFLFIGIAAVINLILDVVFVKYLNFGAGGAALATVISQAVSFVSCTVFLSVKRREFGLDISFKDFFVWQKDKLSELIKLGMPMAIKFASVQVSKLFVNSFINSYGVAVSAFAGIANKIASVANLISNAMNTAGSTMVGQNIAAGEFGRVKRILIELAVITLTVALILSLAICIFPNEIFGLFTNGEDKDVMSLIDGYLYIAVLMFMGAALRAVMNALINGSGNYKINFVTAILDGIVLRIGLALLFGIVFGMKHYGFWLGDAIAGFTPFFVGVIFYFSGLWKKGKSI